MPYSQTTGSIAPIMSHRRGPNFSHGYAGTERGVTLKNTILCLAVLLSYTYLSPICFSSGNSPNEIEFLHDLLYFTDLRDYQSSSAWDMEGYVVDRLAEIGLPAQDMLIESLKVREGFVRDRAAMALSKINDPQILEVLKKKLDQSDPDSVSGIIHALELKNDTPSSLVLSKLVENKNVRISPYKTKPWKEVKDAQVIDNLIKDLEGKDWDTRLYAAEVFTHLREERAVDPLIGVLNDNGEHEINELKERLKGSEPHILKIQVDVLKADIPFCHYHAALALGNIGNEKALKKLQELMNSKTEDYRIFAAKALGVSPKPEARKWLISLIDDKSLYVRYVAYESIGKQKTEEGIKTLKTGLRDKSPEIKNLVIPILAEYRDPALKAVYLNIIKNEKQSSITPVIRALASCEGQEISKSLLDVIFNKEPAIDQELSFDEDEPVNKAATINGNNDDSSIIEAAIEVLKTKKDPNITTLLLKKLQSNDERERSKAARVVGGLKDPSTVSVLRKLLIDDNDPFVKEAAAEALGYFDDPTLLGSLMDAAKNSSPWTNKGAVKALGYYKEKEAVQVLSEIALKDRDWDVRSIAVESLGRIQAPASLEIVITAMNDDQYMVRQVAATALGKFNNPKATDALIKALDTEGRMVNGREVGSWEVCNAAAVALEKSQDQTLQQKLIQLFHSNNYRGRIEAVRLLVQHGWIPTTLGEWIQFDIAAGLFDVVYEKGPATVEPLIVATQETDWRWVGGAAKALGKTKDDRAIEPLIKVLMSENWPRQEAAKALKGFGDARVVKPLISALNDKDWHLREAAAEALGGYKTPDAINALKDATKDPHPSVRNAALESLK
jgi:HEAT repeat protein